VLKDLKQEDDRETPKVHCFIGYKTMQSKTILPAHMNQHYLQGNINKIKKK